MVLLTTISLGSFANGTVTGVILDSDSKEPLIGATVVLSETTNGTVSNVDGSFSLKLLHQTRANFQQRFPELQERYQQRM
jgi:hypothetical protein